MGPRTFLTVREFLIVLPFVGHLPDGSMVGLMATSSKHAAWPRSAAARAPFPAAGHYWPMCLQTIPNIPRQAWLSLLWGPWCSWPKGFVWALRASLVSMGFDSKCNFTPPTVLLGLLLCPWVCCIFFWWGPTFSCWWLFSSELQFWSSCRRRELFASLPSTQVHRRRGPQTLLCS